ncbi:MAG TPA: redoxin domain-containing protein [Gemmatimonadaceae bacterium]|jgi:peroxiredoxin|nr:redoxin domain-containing protein [Gemmatimonadaceae bacterium]
MTADQNPQESDEILAPGTQAPAFTLSSIPGKSYSLADFKGKPVVLAFYPADWSPVCGDQMALYNEMMDEFSSYGAQLFGISVDGVWCHKAFTEQRRIGFPLLSDFEPKGAISRRYGAYDKQGGISRRALFVIDGNGVISWSYLSPIDVNPGADGIFAALDKLTAGSGAPSTREQKQTPPVREQRNEGEVSAR